MSNLQTRELKQARALLVIIGLINIVWQGLLYSELAHDSAAVHASGMQELIALFDRAQLLNMIGIAAGGVYVMCGLLVFRKPVASTVTGLALYLASIAAVLVMNPSALWAGVLGTGIRIGILIGLVSAVQFARIYERNRRQDLAKATVVR